MEISNICPYCGGEMQNGALPMIRDTYVWYPRNADGRLENEWGSDKRVLLGKAGLLGGELNAYYCEGCGVVIVPVPSKDELKSGITRAFEALGRGMDNTLGAVGEKLDRASERREEKAAERKREERRKKDPWEL